MQGLRAPTADDERVLSVRCALITVPLPLHVYVLCKRVNPEAVEERHPGSHGWPLCADAKVFSTQDLKKFGVPTSRMLFSCILERFFSRIRRTVRE